MIKAYLNKVKHPLVFGCKIEDIEGYEEALLSPEVYVIHHVLEWKYTAKELKDMNRYWDVPANELIFMPKSLHSASKYIHKGKINSLNALSHKGHIAGIKHKMNSVFGKGFYAHYHIHFSEDKKLYRRERAYWLKYGKYSWEA